MPYRRKNSKRSKRQKDAVIDSDSPRSYTTPVVKPFISPSRDAFASFKDLRSSSVARKRAKKQKWKYYGHEIVKPGQIGLPHYTAPAHQTFPWLSTWPADFDSCTVVELNKKQLYDLAQATAPVWRSRPSSCCDRVNKYRKRDAERQEIDARRQANEWNNVGLWKDHAGSGQPDGPDYIEEGRADVDDHWDCCYMGGTLPCVEGEEDAEQMPAAYNLATMVDDAMEALDVPAKDLGWEVVRDGADSPDCLWIDVFECTDDEEEFELP